MRHAEASPTTSEGKRFGPFKRADLVLFVTLLLLMGYGVYAFVSCHDSRVLAPVLLGGLCLVGIWAVVRFVRVGDFDFVAHVVFPVVLCALCVTNAILFTPGSVPDEDFHYKKAYVVANLIMKDMDPLEMRTEDVVFNHDAKLFNGDVESAYWDELSHVELHAAQDSHQKAISETRSYEPSVDLPQLRLPAALGIVIGKSLGLSGLVTFLLGRLLNALYAVILIALAVRLAPAGKNALMAVALLPMCLHLAGSYSYDAGILGLALLTVALALRLFYGKGQISVGLMVGFVASTTLLAPCKLIYSLIGLLGVLVPTHRFKSRREALLFKAAVLLVPVVCTAFLWSARSGVLPMGGEEGALASRGDAKGTYYTLGGIVTHPIDSALFLLKTLALRGPFYVVTMLGGYLGWFQKNIMAPVWLDALLLVALLMGVVRATDDEQAMARSLRIGMTAISVLGILAAMMSMWLGWTFTSDEFINGVQGRYFLPYLPCMMLALRPRRLSIPRPLGYVVVMAFVSLDYLYLAYIFQSVVPA